MHMHMHILIQQKHDLFSPSVRRNVLKWILYGLQASTMTDEAPRVRRFFVDVDKKNVEDLKNRLKHTRFPDQLAGAGWDYGSELTFMKVSTIIDLSA